MTEIDNLEAETFKVCANGDVLPGFRIDDVLATLKKQNAAPALIQKLAAKQVVILKKSLTWEKATTIQTKLTKLGLKSAIDLELNPELFYAGLKPLPQETPPVATEQGSNKIIENPLSSAIETDTNTEPPKETWESKKTVLAGLIYTSATKFSLNNSSINIEGHSRSGAWSTTLLVIFSLLTGACISQYCLRLLISEFSSSVPLTLVVSILFYFSSLLILPKLIQSRACIALTIKPKKLHTLSSDHPDKLPARPSASSAYYLIEIPRLLIGQRSYHVHSNTGDIIATISRKKKSSTLTVTNGEIIWWDKQVSAEVRARDTQKDLRDDIADNSGLDNVIEFAGYLGKLSRFIRRRFSSHSDNGETETLFSEKNIPIASYNNHQGLTITIQQTGEHTNSEDNTYHNDRYIAIISFILTLQQSELA